MADHLYSFRRYSEYNCWYVNLYRRAVPGSFARQDWDIVVFHTVLLSTRWDPAYFRRLLLKAARVKTLGGVKIALPQDEFIHSSVLSEFIEEFGVDHVFSVAPESEWPKIYAGVDFGRVQFHNVLTGYVENSTVSKINRLAASEKSRPIDVGYRAWRAEPWLGRHGYLKTQLAEVFQRQTARADVAVDISTRPGDVLRGDEWLRFLLRCRFTLGVEGGASMLDRDGSVMARTRRYVAEHPDASFDEIEQHCFPGLDGTLRLFAISPRHLEACATRTCQILVEGEYDGVLVPGKNYIPLKRDFSNLDEVLALIKREDVRQEIAEAAYHDVVASGTYDYRHFVQYILSRCLRSPRTRPASGKLSVLACGLNNLLDRLSWLEVAILWNVKDTARTLVSRLIGEEPTNRMVLRLKRKRAP